MADVDGTEFLTVRELMDLLKVSRTTAYKLIESGDVPSVRIGGSVRIPRKLLLEALERGAA